MINSNLKLDAVMVISYLSNKKKKKNRRQTLLILVAINLTKLKINKCTESQLSAR